jgi:hypothetical protein
VNYTMMSPQLIRQATPAALQAALLDALDHGTTVFFVEDGSGDAIQLLGLLENAVGWHQYLAAQIAQNN